MGNNKSKEYLELALLAAVIAAAASVLCGWYSERSAVQTGSFEYVRKAEGLIDKGEIRKSIKYLEKAYSSSPENGAIAIKLRNAYFKYGQQLAESGDIDKAINCMMRAYTVSPGSGSAQTLALAYAEKASEKLRRGDLPGARSDFENALETAAPYAPSSRNLGVFLFNKAVEDYKSGKDATAIIFLQQSYSTYNSPAALELLGDIYYKRSEFEEARFYFGKSLSIEPDGISARSKLKKSTMDMRLADTRNVLDSPHFSIMYTKDLPVDTEFVRSALERYYFEVGDDFKYFPDSKTSIIFYPQDEFRRMFMMSAGTRAIYDGNIRVPMPAEKMDGSALANYLRHEYTHAVVGAKTNNNCPVWLSEGLAVWQSSKEDAGAIPASPAASLQPSGFSADRLSKSFDLKRSTDESLEMDYLLSYTAVRYIIDTWGLPGMNRLLVRIKDGEHFLNALDNEFLISQKEFERRWKAYSMKNLT